MCKCLILKDRELLLDRTRVMGILNITPDSFYDGNRYFKKEDAIKRVHYMLENSVSIIDIGAQSTRPGSTLISSEEEWSRLADILPAIRKMTDIIISLDTFYAEVAKRAIDCGVNIINDVTGFSEDSMPQIIAKSGCAVIIMSNVSLDSTKKFLNKAILKAKLCGIKDESICVDPGIGFGKTREEDIEILKNPSKFCPEGYPIVVGASRKRVTNFNTGICKPEENLPATIAAHTSAIIGGADIIRVHDVKESVLAARMVDKLWKSLKI